MDEWIPKLKICPLVGNLYPTPSQLVACWSIQSAVWALPYETNLVIIDNDGNENSIPVFEEYDEVVWRRLITNGMVEAEAIRIRIRIRDSHRNRIRDSHRNRIRDGIRDGRRRVSE